MTYLADQFAGGLDPLQNFQPTSIPLEVRKGRYACRISGHDAAGRPIIEQDSVGDVRNAMLWEPSSRHVAAWSHGMPVVGGSPVKSSGGAFSDPRLVAAEGGAGGGGPGAGGPGAGGPKAGDGLQWKKIGGQYYYWDGSRNSWVSPPITVGPMPFGLNVAPGGALITWPNGRQRDPGFGLNAPGGVYIQFPGQPRGGGAPQGPVGAQGQGGAVGNAGPAGAINPGARSITGESGPSFTATPIRGEYGPDGTIAPKSITLPAGYPSLPGGRVGLVVGGTEHRYEAPTYIDGDPRLVSVNEGPDPSASSVVLDTDPQGRLDPGLSAPLHSAWRVVEPVFSRTATGARGTLAWQLARGERDGVAGYGAVVDTSYRGARPGTPTTSSAASQGSSGAGGSAAKSPSVGVGYNKGAAYEFIPVQVGNYGLSVYTPKTAVSAGPAVGAGAKDDVPALCIGLTSARVGGPIEVGHGKEDKHKIGHSGSRSANVGHLGVGTLFFRDSIQDAPLDFEKNFYPKVAEYPMRAVTHLQYDAVRTHGIPGRSRIPGLWRWWTEVPFTTEGGGGPPLTPGDPNPPGPPPPNDRTPAPPDDPPTTPSDPPTTPPTTPRLPPSGPITPGGREPTDPPPPAASSGAGAAVGGARKPPLTDYDGTFTTFTDEVGTIPSVGLFPSMGGFVKPRSPGGKTDKIVVHPGVEAFTAITFKPQGTDSATLDLRSAARPAASEIEKQSAARPTTLRAEAYGGQTGGVWQRTQSRGASRYTGGTGPGGVVYLPPEQDVMDVDRASFVPSSSTAYIGAVPGVYFAVGKPLLSTGGWKTGTRWGADALGNSIFSTMSSTGTATPAITIDTTAGVTLGAKFALAGVVSPTAIAAHTNNYNPTGLSGAAILRLSSSAAYNITGLAGGSDDRMLVVTNVGAYAITLKNSDASSSAANRFLFGADLVLAPEEGVWLTYDNTSARWRRVAPSSSGSSAVADADYGDVVVSSSGTVWTIDAGVVTYAKIQDVSATDKILGRKTAGSGVVEEIDCTAAGRALLDDANSVAQRTTLGLGGAAVLSVGTTAGTVAAGDDSRLTDSRNPTAYVHTDAQTDIVNDSSEQTLWSKSVASMAAGDRVAVDFGGDYLNDSAGAVTFVVRVKFGSTTLWQCTSPSMAKSSLRRAMNMRFVLSAFGATNAQRVTGWFAVGLAAAPTTGTGTFGAGPFGGAFYGSSAEDTTSAQTLSVTIQHSTNDANLSIRLQHGTAEFIKA